MEKEIIKRLESLERSTRVLIAYIEDLKERIGDTLATDVHGTRIDEALEC